MILAGDVGGTKTQLALFEPGGSARAPMTRRRFASRDFPSLEALIDEFVRECPAAPSRAVIGIAGPVVDNRVETTNLPWTMSGERVSTHLKGAPVTLLNDLVTTAHGLSELSDGDLRVLQAGEPAQGNRVLIAAGTGLGEALVIRDGERWMPVASEGGHSDFGPRNEFEDGLCRWLRAKYGRVSWERLLSGPGFVDLYRYHREMRLGDEPAACAHAFDAADDPAVVITAHGLDGSCERASLVIDRFLEMYGAEAGNLALKGFAVGGVFVGGGIAPKLAPRLAAGGFLDAFRQKGRLTPLLERIPVAVILDEQTSLWGAAHVALDGSH